MRSVFPGAFFRRDEFGHLLCTPLCNVLTQQWVSQTLGLGSGYSCLLEDISALKLVKETFPGLVDVDTEAISKAWKFATAVLNECIVVSVLLDAETDKPSKKKVLEGVMKKAESQGVTDLLHKAIVAETAKILYDRT